MNTLRVMAAAALGLGLLPPAAMADGVTNRTIGFVLTNKAWAVYQTPSGKAECPNGMNDGPREQFKALFPEDGAKRTLVEGQLAREAASWFPTLEADRFPFREAQGKIAYGLNLDGKVKDGDFTSPDGDKGIDNQLYRAIGCINSYRDAHGTNDELNALEVVKESYNRWLIEITGIDSLENSPHVEVTVYRGLDPLRTDAGGKSILPGGTQRIDTRWGKRFIQHYRGRIVDGVLETEPGEQMQLDWIEFRKSRGDLLAAFVATLGWSRASFARFVDNERAETLIECTRAAFDYFGGVTRSVLADNMKTIVDRRNAFGEGQHRWHPGFLDLSQQYGFKIRLCAPYRARTKGKVERMNGYLRYSFYVPLGAQLKAVGARPDCLSANAAIGPWLEDVANARVHGTTGEVPTVRLAIERGHLIKLPRDHRLTAATVQEGNARGRLDGIAKDLPKPSQHPLSVYAALLMEAA